MFKDVQQLKIKELESQVDRLKAKQAGLQDDVRALKDQLWDLQSQERMGMSAYRGKKRFSAWERLVTQRKAYRDYQAKLAELAALPHKIAKLTSEIEIATMQATDQIEKSGVVQEIQAVEHSIWEIDQATTLAQLGMTPTDAVKLLAANGITPVLDESDRAIFERPRHYQSKADLIAVHKMDIMPTGSRLTTVGEAKVECTETVTLDGKEYAYSFLLERNTMHVSLNDEVSSHLGGNWDNCHYTVLQPFAEIPNEHIGAVEPNDTFTRGGIDLTQNAWILCPAAEVETVQSLNPEVHVLGYQAENSKGLAAPFLSQLGYRAETVGQWGWEDQQSQQQFYDLAEREKLHIVQHSNSTDAEDEEFQIGTNKAIAIIKMLRDQNLVQSREDFARLRPQLEKVGFSNALDRMGSVTQVSEAGLISDVAIVANQRQVDVLAEKMARAGMPLSSAEQAMLQTQMHGFGTEHAREMRNGLGIADFTLQIMVDSMLRSRTMETERAL